MTFRSGLRSDLLAALRQFRHRPALSATIVIALAIGLAVSTTVFVAISSFTSGPPAGITASDETVRVRGIDRSRGPGRAMGRELSAAEIDAVQAERAVFRTVAAWTSTDVTLDLGADAPDLHSGAVTFVRGDYFGVLGVRFPAGVGFSDSTTAESASAGVISDAIWDRYFDRSPSVIGRRIRVNTSTITIVGVAPRRFVGARSGGSAMRVWLPLEARTSVLPSATRIAEDSEVFGVIARLQPGVSHTQATTVVASIATRFGSSGDERPGRRDADVVPVLASNYFPPSGEPSSGVGRFVSVLMPILVMLITGTSVSALLAGVALGRQREVGVRLALGAGRWRIVRQLLTETAALAMVAGGVALLVVRWLIEGLEASIDGMPLTMDWQSAVFAAALALVASVAFGLSPALHATRLAVSDVLKETSASRSRTRLQATLVVAQIALTQPALLAMGGLLIELRREGQAVAQARAVDDFILEVEFNTNPRYGAMDQSRELAIARIQERLAAMPGVLAVTRRDTWGVVAQVSAGRNTVEAEVEFATEGLLEVRGWSLVEGRVPRADGRDDEGVALINQRLAQSLWGDGSVIGRQFQAESDLRRAGLTLTVVGVVDDGQSARYYVPEARLGTSHLLVRGAAPAAGLVASVREAALSAAPEMPIVAARPLSARDADARRSIRRGLVFAGTAGVVALLLAAIGLYAVVAVAVGQRRHEIGVRAALGAEPRRIVALFLGRGLGLAAVGLVIGLFGSMVVLRLLAELAGGEPTSGMAALSAGVAGFVLLVAVLAAWVPARQAAAIDPLSVLRIE